MHNYQKHADREKRMIIIRGLPSSGKSSKAKSLAGDVGKVFSTDEYWYRVNCPDKPNEYSFDKLILKEAHEWNIARTHKSIDEGYPLIIVDNVNAVSNHFCCAYARYAHLKSYQVEIQEPDTPWWLKIRELLQNKNKNWGQLLRWAGWLSTLSSLSHHVPAQTIESLMLQWEPDLTAEEVLSRCLQDHQVI